jgi:decaprenylphospho-beta-D-ribofuranose 2-oxidase
MDAEDRHGRVELIHGWGRTAATAAVVLRPRSADEAAAALDACAGSARGVIARGLGRSYGDAAQNAGGTVLDLCNLRRIVRIDAERRQADVEAGVGLETLMRACLPLGLWPVVTPGTRQVTVGGAIASDVHGKNHHANGSFAANVRRLRLHTPGLGTVEVGPGRDPELFWATAGGMGLTGVVLDATVELLAVETASMRVETERLGDLDTLMARMVEADRHWRYSVAWVDGLARGARLGRSIFEVAEHATVDDLPSRARRDPLRFAPRPLGTVPDGLPSGLLNRWSAAAFNELWYRKAPRRGSHVVEAHRYFHPLDGVREWNRLYGPRGLVQYQFVVPDGREDCVRVALETFSSARCSSFLAVLKRFGPANRGPLSFPTAGWTLALDLPSVPLLQPLLDGLDEVVAEAGGRVYLSKDSRLRPELLEVMYPELGTWRRARDRADPGRVLHSDLARRLGLLGSESSQPADADLLAG